MVLFLCAELYSTVAPVIQQRPQVIRIEKKRTIIVECHVKAQSAPTCMWYKEQSIVQKSSKHLVHVKKISEVLTCSYLSAHDVLIFY